MGCNLQGRLACRRSEGHASWPQGRIMAAQTRGSRCLRAAPARGRRQAGERWRARETGPLRVDRRKLRIVPVYRNLWCCLSDSGISGAVSEDAMCSTTALICIPTLSRQDRWRGRPCHVTGLLHVILPSFLLHHGNRRDQKC